ncbi:MAG: oligosaccharide flippase family protein [Caldilineaceae bacterium]
MQQASEPLPSTGSPPASTTTPPAATGHPVGRRVLTNTSALAASNLWRIFISFILQLMISRRLGVEGMGYYTIALTYLNVCQVISELGLPAMLTRDLAQFPTQRRAYFRYSFLLQLGLAIVLCFILAIVSQLLPIEATAQRILWIVGLSLPLYAVTSSCQTLFQAGERLELIFGVETLVNTLILAASLAILWNGGSVLGLVAVLVGTQLLSAIICLLLLRFVRLMSEPQEEIALSFNTLWQRSRPFFGLALADVLLQRLDTLLLSVLGNVTITGIYGTSDNLVRVLLKIVQSLWRAIYPTLSRMRNQSQSRYFALCRLSLRYGLIVLVPGAALGAVVAPDLMRLVYEDSFAAYAPVLQIAIWTAPAFLLELYAVTIFMVENRPLYSVLITGVHLIVMAILLPLLIGGAGALGAAIAVTIAGVMGSLVGIGLILRNQLPLDLSKLGQIVIAAAVSAMVALLLPTSWYIKVAVGGCIDLILLWLMRALTMDDIEGVVTALLGRSPQLSSKSRI